MPERRDLLKELLLFGWEEKINVDFELVDDSPSEPFIGHVITVSGARVTAADFGAVAEVIADNRGNKPASCETGRSPALTS